MFNDNWFLFLLIIMLVFAGDGTISHTETLVMLGILAALALSCGICGDPDDNSHCSCGGRLTT